MSVYDSCLHLGILRITMDFTAGLARSVTEAVKQSMLWYQHITVEIKWHCFMSCFDLSLRKSLHEKNRLPVYLIIIYEKIYEHPGDLFWLCKYAATWSWTKRTGKEGIKTLFADWNLDNCVCFREPIIIGDKNNENAIFIIDIQPPQSLHKKWHNYFFLLKYSSTSMTFWRKVAKITMVIN